MTKIDGSNKPTRCPRSVNRCYRHEGGNTDAVRQSGPRAATTSPTAGSATQRMAVIEAASSSQLRAERVQRAPFRRRRRRRTQ